MNDPDRLELARLKQQQERLEIELRALSRQLGLLAARVGNEAVKDSRDPEKASKCLDTTASLPPAAASPPTRSPIVPPLISQVPSKQGFGAPPLQEGPATADPTPVLQASATPFLKSPSEAPRGSQAMPVPTTAASAPPFIHTEKAPASPRSFEMRLGTYWLVRIGIVMVLTGLVFFGNLAYQNYISRLGPVGKISLLYLASSLLLAAGWWWQRKAIKDTLKNYAQVLFAGGLSALYFTTYAAHHLEPLRVIQSALLDGFLLLFCASFMIWAAERKRSEVLALFAVGLAYYTSIITRVGYFTLWSNLVLSAAAVFFLVRNRWARLSFGGLAATYTAYGFWRFFDGTHWQWAAPNAGLWSGTAFLMMYWLVFTSAVFLCRDSRFSGQNRASFLTFNNGAFFTLFVLSMLQVQHGGFWRFCLLYGALLLALARIAKRLLAEEPLVSNAYLTQGLLLVTVGFIAKFAGLQLALILAVESVLLLVAGQQRGNRVLLVGAYVAGLLSVAWGMDGLKPFDRPGLWLGSGLGLLMLINAFVASRRQGLAWDPRRQTGRFMLRLQSSYFAVLSLLIWSVVTWHNTSPEIFPLALGAESVLLTLSIYVLGVPEVTLLSQVLMLVAQGAWFLQWTDQSSALPWWNPACLIVLSLVLSHWWPRQKTIQLPRNTALAWPALYALGINLLLYLWLAPRLNAPTWLVTTSLLAIGLTVYGTLTRAWFVAAAAQLFMGVSVAQFGLQLWGIKPPGQFALAPIAALSLLALGTVQWFKRATEPDSRVRAPLLEAALVYRWMALLLAIIWVCDYVPERERIWILGLLGFLVFLAAGWLCHRQALLFSAAFSVTALALFWLPFLQASTVYWPNVLFILGLLAQAQMARRWSERYRLEASIHHAAILVGGLSLWLFVSRWILEMASGFYLTAGWSVLALGLFTAGLALRERVYRWMGLGLLACALGRVVLFDVWKLESVYRILSFMALGIVLLVLGFIYSKYQEKIRQWL